MENFALFAMEKTNFAYRAYFLRYSHLNGAKKLDAKHIFLYISMNCQNCSRLTNWQGIPSKRAENFLSSGIPCQFEQKSARFDSDSTGLIGV